MTNAIQFIQQNGVEKAREVVEGAPETATHFMYDYESMMADYLKYRPDVSEFSFDLWCGKPWGWKPLLRTKKRIDLSELKPLVEGVDFINKIGGLVAAKSFWAKGSFKNCYKEKLKQAVEDYEAIGGEHV